MLKPIETLSVMRNEFDLTEHDIELQHTKLIEALAISARDSHVAAIFAHGADALRVVYMNDEKSDVSYWALQTWSVFLQEWITQQEFRLTDKEKAIETARNWYEPMSHAKALEKWRGINDVKGRRTLFGSGEKLVEFFYDTKAIEWPNGNPWPIMTLIASTLVEFKGILSSEFSFRRYAANQNIDVDNLGDKVISIIGELEETA